MIKYIPSFLLILLLCSFALPVSFGERLAKAAIQLTAQRVVYDPTYFRISYPKGDVPVGKGVCTDVVIRAYRQVGIDLQQRVHEDMKAHFALYPKIWKLKHPDTNIDHRRVPNLMVFFARYGQVKTLAKDASAYVPGDIVCWNLGGAVTHIGLVSDKKSIDGERYLIVHNIGAGQVMEDVLFTYTIIGHYFYSG